MTLRLVKNDDPLAVRCDEPGPPPKGRKVHRCCVCEKQGVWDENWAWYGNLIQEEDGDIDKVCSAECRSAFDRRRKRAKRRRKERE